MKPWIAAALMVVPLLIAAAVTYWPVEPVDVSSVVIPPPDVHTHDDISALAREVPSVLARRLMEIPRLKVQVAETDIGPEQAAAFDAVIITTLTEDAGIIQLNVQAVSPRTRKEIWSNAYQSSRRQFSEMLQAAGDGVRRAFD